MAYYAGIDVSLKESSVCVVDAKGKVVREIKVASEPEAVVRYFDALELPMCRIGLEAGPLSAKIAGSDSADSSNSDLPRAMRNRDINKNPRESICLPAQMNRLIEARKNNYSIRFVIIPT
jgi:hypothetical protein